MQSIDPISREIYRTQRTKVRNHKADASKSGRVFHRRAAKSRKADDKESHETKYGMITQSFPWKSTRAFSATSAAFR
jgi:hypothetical protein